MRVSGSAAKRLATLLAATVLGAVVLEASLWLLEGLYPRFFRQRIDPSSVTLEAATRVTSSGTFDAELGWDRELIARDHVGSKRYLAQSYGDSFVGGVGVDTPDTWQAQFERLTGQAIVNLGVGGYGLDQAILKFEKYASRYPARIAILGLYHQMFRRARSYHAFYYFAGSNEYALAFKPIFAHTAGGFTLIPPPCASASCLVSAVTDPDHEARRALARYDYWYRVNERKPPAQFPYTLAALRAIPEIRRWWRERRGEENYVFVDAEALAVAEHLVERFARDSRARAMTPVCVLLHSVADLRLIREGRRFDRELRQFLSARGIPTVDTSTYILGTRGPGDPLDDLGLPDRHLSAEGNRMVAAALAEGLASLGLLER